MRGDPSYFMKIHDQEYSDEVTHSGSFDPLDNEHCMNLVQ